MYKLFYASGFIPPCIPATNEVGKPFKKWDGTTLAGDVGSKSPCDEDGATVYGENTGGYCLKLTANQVAEIYWSWRTYKTSCDVQINVSASGSAYGVTAAASASDFSISEIFADGWVGGIIVPGKNGNPAHIYEKPIDLVCGPAINSPYYNNPTFSEYYEIKGVDGDPFSHQYPVIDDATYNVPDGDSFIFDGYIDSIKQSVFGMAAKGARDQKSKSTEVSDKESKYGQGSAYSEYKISIGGIAQVTGIPIYRNIEYLGYPINRPYLLPLLGKQAIPFDIIQVKNSETGVDEYWLRPNAVISCSTLASSSSFGYDSRASGINESVLNANYRIGWFETDSSQTDGPFTYANQSVSPIKYTLIFKDKTEVSADIPFGKHIYLFQNPGLPQYGWTGTTDANVSENVTCTSVTVEVVDSIKWDS